MKSPFRSTITTTWLSGLTLLNLHQDIPINVSAAIDEFARRHPRRMKMVNVLNDDSEQSTNEDKESSIHVL